MSASASAPSVIVVDGVSKRFRIPREQVHTLKERLVHPLRRPGYDQLQALRDVSFDVRRENSSASSDATARASQRC